MTRNGCGCYGVEGKPSGDPRPMPRAATEALIARYFDALASGDVDALLACLAADVIHDVNQGERRIGRDTFKAFHARMTHCYEERLEGVVVLAGTDGTRAAAEYMMTGRYVATDEGLPPATGQTYALPAGTFFAVRDGLIQRVTAYYNLTDWLLQIAPGIG